MNWGYFVLGLVAYQLFKMLALSINQAAIEHRQKRILRLVSVAFPENKTITFISVDATDKRAMGKLERHLREEFDLTEEEIEDIRRGDGFRN